MTLRRFLNRPVYVFGTMVILSVLLHWKVWDNDIAGIHAWRQTQTMTVVENFAFEDMNILNPRINSRGDGDGIFRMEFPLMQWGFAWFYRWFGNELIIARLLSFLISIFSVIGFYRLLRAWKQTPLISGLGAWCYGWSPVLFYYAINPLPDNLALCFGIWSLVFLKRFQLYGNTVSLVGFGVFLSMATAVKLPFILFGAGYIPLFFEQLRNKDSGLVFYRSMLIPACMTPAAAWYIWVIPTWGNAQIISGAAARGSFDLMAALNTIWGTLTFMLIELFINYGALLFFLFGLIFIIREKHRILISFKVELSILCFLALFFLYEVNVIGLAHDYYHFPFLPIIFLVVAKGLQLVLYHKLKWLRRLGYLALLIVPLTAYLRTQNRWEPSTKALLLLNHKQQLRNAVPNDALVVTGNDISRHIMLYHIGKKGWVFRQDRLTADQLQRYIDRGAEYLYSNSGSVSDKKEIQILLGNAIFEKDGITVYPLKRPNGS